MPPFHGTVAYEMNPPPVIDSGIIDGKILREKMGEFLRRAERVAEVAKHILITDSVLGRPRLSSIYTAYRVKQLMPKLGIFCSLRTCDHSFEALLTLVSEAESIGVDGILLVKGDPPFKGATVNDTPPSSILTNIRSAGYKQDGKISFYLSVDHHTSLKNLKRKLAAKPDGLITQLIDSEDKFSELLGRVKKAEVELVACIMAPSRENEISARKFGIQLPDSQVAAKRFAERLLEVGDGLVISSPRSFESGLNLLRILNPTVKKSFTRKGSGVNRKRS